MIHLRSILSHFAWVSQKPNDWFSLWFQQYWCMHLCIALTEDTNMYGSPLSITEFADVLQLKKIISDHYLIRGPFTPMKLTGFLNIGIPGKHDCDSLSQNGTIGIQKTWHLKNNKTQIAGDLDSNAMVNYHEDLIKNPSVTVADIVESKWFRFGGSAMAKGL